MVEGNTGKNRRTAADLVTSVLARDVAVTHARGRHAFAAETGKLRLRAVAVH